MIFTKAIIDKDSLSRDLEVATYPVIRIYKNGTQIYIRDDVTNYGGNGYLGVGAAYGPTQTPTFKLNNFRVVKGTAVYTGNFTPPTGNLTATGGSYSDTTNVNTSIPSGHTSIILGQQSSGTLSDTSGNSHSLTVTGAAANTDNPWYGDITVPTVPLTAITNTKLLTCQRSSAGYTSINSASTKFAGVTGTSNNGYTYIDSPSNSALQLGNADWTIEFWINTGDMGDTQLPFDYDYPAANGSGMMMYITNTGMLTAYQGAEVLRSDGTYLPLMQKHTWYHVALVRHSNVLRM